MLACAGGTSVALRVLWQPMAAHPHVDRQLQDVYVPGTLEVQVALASAAPFMPFFSATTSHGVSELVLDDLLPDTEYLLASRLEFAGGAWGNLSEPIACATGPLLPLQPHVLPPNRQPTTTSFWVTISEHEDGSPRPSVLVVEYRAVGQKAWKAVGPWQPQSSIEVGGLQPGTAYEVRVQAGEGPVSDAVLHRTANPDTVDLVTFRISELCGEDCEPDYLPNHDSGSLLADVSFITLMAAKKAQPKETSPFVTDFNASVITRYCVAMHDAPFADYVSCNGRKPWNYSCACNNWVDRCIGRLDRSSCHNNTHSAFMPSCSCTNASLAASSKRIGRMPVYYPYPDFRHFSNSSCAVPPLHASTYLGDWYSMPAEAECDPGTAAFPGLNACTWARQPRQHFVHGHELVLGRFNVSGPFDLVELQQNEAVIQKAFARHPSRCCGC